MRRINVDGIKVASCSVRKAIDFVSENRESLNGKYITFVNMYSLVCAREDHCYKKAQQGAAVSFADGFPVVAYQKLHGGRFAKRVPGPEFMKRLLEISSKRGGKESHFFLGSDYETLSKLTDNLRYRFPSINIAGIYDPGKIPTIKDAEGNGIEAGREELEAITEEIIKRINEASPDIIWVGLGTPKQEYVMEALKGRTDAVMFGVGAAFDFMAGTKKRAPRFIRKIHMEWAYRLVQEPARLFNRYFKCAMMIPILFLSKSKKKAKKA